MTLSLLHGLIDQTKKSGKEKKTRKFHLIIQENKGLRSCVKELEREVNSKKKD